MSSSVTEAQEPPANAPLVAPATGLIETRGLDYIPSAERHGKPFDLFWVWMGANVNYLSFVFGGLLILIGLSVWEAIVASVIGNLWYLAVGWLSVSGPASGTPSVTVMRSMFGVRGNWVFGAGQGLVIGIFYEIINITVATLASLALLDLLGIAVPVGIEWIVLVAVVLLSIVLSIYGHTAIVKASPYLSVALAVAFVILAVFVLQAADFQFVQAELDAAEHWPTLLLGYAIVASGPLSWGTGADYSRYLPKDASKGKVVMWVALGGFIPTIFISVLGIFAATVIDMTDPEQTIGEIVPAWFTPVFLGIVVLGSITNNAVVAYSLGLSLQGVGVRLHRVTTVIITGAVAAAASMWLTFFSPGFVDTMEYALELTVAILAPLIAIYAVDILLRRNNYNGIALNNESSSSAFWYSRGIFWPGVIAQVAGTAISLLMINSTLFVGPIAQALNGADLSSIFGPLVGGGLYALLWLHSAPFKNPKYRPGAEFDLQKQLAPVAD